jgi:acyl carrier protein
MREHAETIEAFIVAWLATELVPPVGDVDPSRSLLELGLDSLDAAKLVGDLEDRFGCVISPGLFFEHPTIARFSAHLAEGLATTLRRAP